MSYRYTDVDWAKAERDAAQFARLTPPADRYSGQHYSDLANAVFCQLAGWPVTRDSREEIDDLQTTEQGRGTLGEQLQAMHHRAAELALTHIDGSTRPRRASRSRSNPLARRNMAGRPQRREQLKNDLRARGVSEEALVGKSSTELQAMLDGGGAAPKARVAAPKRAAPKHTATKTQLIDKWPPRDWTGMNLDDPDETYEIALSEHGIGAYKIIGSVGERNSPKLAEMWSFGRQLTEEVKNQYFNLPEDFWPDSSLIVAAWDGEGARPYKVFLVSDEDISARKLGSYPTPGEALRAGKEALRKARQPRSPKRKDGINTQQELFSPTVRYSRAKANSGRGQPQGFKPVRNEKDTSMRKLLAQENVLGFKSIGEYVPAEEISDIDEIIVGFDGQMYSVIAINREWVQFHRLSDRIRSAAEAEKAARALLPQVKAARDHLRAFRRSR